MKKYFNVCVIITLIYAVLTLLCVFNHEVFNDEIQVWQLAKYLNPIELFNRLHNEGHPAFFYLLVMPFAKLFSNGILMQLICWLSSCLAVFILLKYAPFKLYVKLAIISSAGFLYFYPVIARSYSILPVLVFLAAILYLSRKKHPVLYALVLFLIANTHIIMFGFVFVLFVFFLKDIVCEKLYKNNFSFPLAAFFMFIGLCLVLFQIHDTTVNNSFISIHFDRLWLNAFKVIPNFFANAYLYKHEIYDVGKKLFLFDIIAIFIIFINFVMIFINLFLNNKRMFLIAFLSVCFQLVIYIFAYPHYIFVNRIFSAYIIIIFCMWILIADGTTNKKYKICSIKAINIMLFIMFILTFKNGLNYYLMDVKELKQAEQPAVDFISENIDKNSFILTEHEPHSLNIVYLLKGKYKIYSVVRDEELKYVKWDDKAIQLLSNNDWILGAIYYRQKYQNIYVIIPRNMGDEDKKLNDKFFIRIYPDKISNKEFINYTIYKFLL